MQKSFLLLLISCFLYLPGIAQTYYVLSGTVRDAETGEDLTGATLSVQDAPVKGTVVNNYGFYSLTLPAGFYRLQVQHVGYETLIIPADLKSHDKLDIELQRISYELGELNITGWQADRNVTSVEMGTVQMIPRNLENLPVIFGEPDIMKMLQLTPGIKPAGEGNSGFHVRGGSTDQNLILLDEAPIYGASHLMGFFSVFNSEALKKVTLMKGSIPAEYGGRASSVLDIRMKEGNLKKAGMTGDIGLISSKATVEGPFIKDKGSFILSGRRTYADLFLGLSDNPDIRQSDLYFYDLNLKTNLILNSRNRIYLSGFTGRDNFNYQNNFHLDWGNITGSLRWNHIFSEKLFSNTTFIFSNYFSNITLIRDYDIHFRSVIKNINLKQDFTFYLNPDNTLKFGFKTNHHTILPGRINLSEAFGIDHPDEIADRRALEWAAYFSNEQRVSDRILLYYGLRFSLFSNIGPGIFYEFDEKGELANTTRIDGNTFYKTQGGLEPRLGFNYRFSNSGSLKASYSRLHQYLHLISNTTTNTPTEIWLPTSNNVKPQISDQVAMGVFQNFAQDDIETSVEVYYKQLQNQIEYKNSAELVYHSTIESELIFGKGWGYGAEFMIRRNTGRINGWLSYTWSKTMRQFDKINNGNPFPAHHDRTHDFSAVMMVDVTPRIKFSSTWVYYTGNAVTFPSGKYQIEEKQINYYTERNGFRMPDYHRLDLSLVLYGKIRDNFESSWHLSVYNAYGRENPYFIKFRNKEDNPSELEAVQVSLFKAVPSLSYKFKF